MTCKYCGSDEFDIIKKDDAHIGMYCKTCGKWIKWVGKNLLSADVMATLQSGSITAPKVTSCIMDKVVEICGERCESCRFVDAELNNCSLNELLNKEM